MSRNLLFTFLFLTFAVTAWGQADDGLVIKGIVEDEDGTPVPFANAALYDRGDSSLVTGAVSNESGQFTIPTSPGQYYLKVSFLSYEEKIVLRIDVTSSDIDLGKIVLLASQQVLEEVMVQSERSSMELYLDKRVFNVGKDLTSMSGSASDVLDNVPSVTVDVEGNVSLRGSENVRILINGKPSGLTGISTADALQ